MTTIKKILEVVVFIFCVAVWLYVASYVIEVKVATMDRIFLNSIILTAILAGVLCLMGTLLSEKGKRANVIKEVMWHMTLIFTLATVIQIVAVTSMPPLGMVISALVVLVIVVYFWEIDQMFIVQKRKE